MKPIKVGIIKGIDIMMNRTGKANRIDDGVKMGCGVHIPSKYKEKSKQKTKNELRSWY